MDERLPPRAAGLWLYAALGAGLGLAAGLPAGFFLGASSRGAAPREAALRAELALASSLAALSASDAAAAERRAAREAAAAALGRALDLLGKAREEAGRSDFGSAGRTLELARAALAKAAPEDPALTARLAALDEAFAPALALALALDPDSARAISALITSSREALYAIDAAP
jgi:hypothetical protein